MNDQTKFDLATIVEAAQDVFWAEIVKQFPDVENGDFPPDATVAFNEACTEAVRVWAEYNAPTTFWDARREARRELSIAKKDTTGKQQ